MRADLALLMPAVKVAIGNRNGCQKGTTTRIYTTEANDENDRTGCSGCGAIVLNSAAGGSASWRITGVSPLERTIGGYR